MTVSLFDPPAPPKGDEYTSQADLPANQPEVVFDEIIEQIRWAIEHQPRSLQERIGPSEIGEPCPRALIAKLMGLPEPDELPNFRAWVGVCMHTGFERILADCMLQHAGQTPRYLLEQEVSVGTIGGVEITGHCDCFDTWSGTVVDHKSKSRTRMTDHRRHGPGPGYRVQAHLYGYGWARRGYWVNNVMNIYYPRDGELHDVFYWAEPYDESIAIAAMERANQLYELATLLGADVAMQQFPPCDGEFCRVCGNYRRPFNAPKPVVTTIEELLDQSK